MALFKNSPFSREVGILPGGVMLKLACRLWNDEQGQDIAEYAVMLAVILVLVVGTVRLIGSNANNAFSAVASSIQ
jgi:Flp pilus assembly pilin Flp